MNSTRRQREGLEILRRIDQYIGDENSDPDLHITLAAGFINSIYSNASPHDLRVRAATNLIFKALLSRNRGDDWARWAATIFGRLTENPRASLLDLCREHPLPIDEINHVSRQIRRMEGHTSSSR